LVYRCRIAEGLWLVSLEPTSRLIWIEKTETVDRVRRRIAAILDAAISDDLRTESNPVIWRGSLHGKLPSIESVKKAKAPTEERAHAIYVKTNTNSYL
tara:strand:- start:326 stop:619 length:294 start_codon:yes stop_codon:yes gene_type:complete